MEQSFITTILLPVSLGIIMLGLGLTLTPDDFRRVFKYPRAVFIGLLVQLIALPLLCLLLVKVLRTDPVIAVGFMVLAASPGGTTASLYSHLFKGDVALNITLTAVNSVVSLFTMPLVVNLALMIFLGDGKTLPLQHAKVMQVFAIVLTPMTIGMIIRHRFPEASKRLYRPVKIASALFLVLIIAGAIAQESQNFVKFFREVGATALLFNLTSMAVGYMIPLITGLNKGEAIAISMEIGIHNAAFAITIAASPMLLNNGMMAVPPAVYGLIMMFTAAGFGFLVSRKHGKEDENAKTSA